MCNLAGEAVALLPLLCTSRQTAVVTRHCPQVEHGYRMQPPQSCPAQLYDIMLECWHKDPVKRPTFETLQWKLEDFFTMSDSEYKVGIKNFCGGESCSGWQSLLELLLQEASAY